MFLLFLSFTASFQSERGVLPSLLGLLTDRDGSLLNTFSARFEMASNVAMPQSNFWMNITMFLLFINLVLSPLLLVLSVILLIVDYASFLKQTKENNTELWLIIHLVFFSQAFFGFCILSNMQQIYFSSFRLIAFVVLSIGFWIYSECHSENATDTRISTMLKMIRLLSGVVSVASLFLAYEYTPETFFWRFVFFCTVIICFFPRYWFPVGHCFPSGVFAALLFSLVNSSFSVNLLIKAAAIFLIYRFVIKIDRYYLHRLVSHYYSVDPSKILEGEHHCYTYTT